MDKEMGPLVSGCIIDTNILIYHLAGVLTDQAEATLAAALESGSYISIITRIELLGWRKHSPDSLKAAEALLQSISEIPLHEEIIRLCISFRQNYPANELLPFFSPDGGYIDHSSALAGDHLFGRGAGA